MEEHEGQCGRPLIRLLGPELWSFEASARKKLSSSSGGSVLPPAKGWAGALSFLPFLFWGEIRFQTTKIDCREKMKESTNLLEPLKSGGARFHSANRVPAWDRVPSDGFGTIHRCRSSAEFVGHHCHRSLQI